MKNWRLGSSNKAMWQLLSQVQLIMSFVNVFETSELSSMTQAIIVLTLKLSLIKL